MSSDVSIHVRGLGKQYLRGAHHHHFDSMRELLVHRLQRLVGRARREAELESFWALRDASFDIRRGENVGIIGLNGAGKSTLLKLLSRITEPTTGYARIEGRIGALLEVGTGFHPELTGRENVFLYGSILGMTQREVARKFDAIVAFSDVSDFIETPVKRYSSGMYVRLAFSVAAHLDPEILFLDEVLAVGDLAFQRKCLDYAKNLQQRDATILFVSHNMFSIKSMCDRVIYVKKGRIEFDGDVEQGIALYEADSRLAPATGVWGEPDEWPIRITACELLDGDGRPRAVFELGEPMTIRLHYAAPQRLERPGFTVSLVRADGVVASTYSTEVDGVDTGAVHGEGVVELRLPPLRLVAEMYTVNVVVRERGFQEILCSQTAMTMHVRHELLNIHFGVFYEPGSWAFDAARPAERAGVVPLLDTPRGQRRSG
jgi:lipopolysaccharide transport system ATP-binding protein